MSRLWCILPLPALATATFLGFSVPPPLYSQSAAPPFLVHNVRVFDGTRLLHDQTVLVRDGRISEIGATLSAPAGATLMDGTGQTLLPGLIDSHIHLGGEAAALKQALVFGVTTALGMFDNPALVENIKRRQAAGEYTDHADLLSAGTCVTAPTW